MACKWDHGILNGSRLCYSKYKCSFMNARERILGLTNPTSFKDLLNPSLDRKSPQPSIHQHLPLGNIIQGAGVVKYSGGRSMGWRVKSRSSSPRLGGNLKGEIIWTRIKLTWHNNFPWDEPKMLCHNQTDNKYL